MPNKRNDVGKTFLLFGVMAIFCCFSVKAAAGVKADKKAIHEVKNALRIEANASWWGFDEADSTHALQEAIRSKAKKIFVPNLGMPWIVEPIFLESNKEIVFEKGVVVAAKYGSFRGGNDCLFKAMNKKNIKLIGYGAQLVMRKEDYAQPPYEKAESRHCLSFEGCQDIKIYGLRLSNSGGDGIYIGRGIGDGSLKRCENVHIKDVVCDRNYRQGISIISAFNLLIEDSVFKDTEGTPPQAGIDFEPNWPYETLINCKVHDCVIDNNSGFGLIIYLAAYRVGSKPISIEITSCQINANKGAPIFIAGPRRKLPKNNYGTIKIRNCRIDGHIKFRNKEYLDISLQ